MNCLKRKDFKDQKKKLGTMDLILLILGIFLLCFVIAMTVIFVICGSIPDTLVTCVFGICGIEGGVMGWIKTSKNKLQKLKSKDQTCNNSGENSNYSLNYCEEEEITEIPEVDNEQEEETFE